MIIAELIVFALLYFLLNIFGRSVLVDLAGIELLYIRGVSSKTVRVRLSLRIVIFPFPFVKLRLSSKCLELTVILIV